MAASSPSTRGSPRSTAWCATSQLMARRSRWPAPRCCRTSSTSPLRKDTSFRVRLIWRNALEAGVQFTADDSSGVVSLDAARSLRKRKAEIERLRRRVSELTDGQ
jgi:hypothetical protein